MVRKSLGRLCAVFAAVQLAVAPTAFAETRETANQQAAELQGWLRDLRTWSQPYFALLLDQKAIMSALDARIKAILSKPESIDPAATKTWAITQRDALAKIENRARALRNAPPSPPRTPDFVESPTLKAIADKLPGLLASLSDLVEKDAELSGVTLDKIEAAARGDAKARSDLRRSTFEIYIAVVENDDALIETELALSPAGQPQRDLGEAALESSFVLLEVEHFALAELYGEGVKQPRAAVAASLRRHADRIDQLANAMDRDAAEQLAKVKTDAAFAETPMFEKLNKVAASFGESSANERAIANAIRREAVRFEGAGIAPLEAVKGLAELQSLRRREDELQYARQAMLVN